MAPLRMLYSVTLSIFKVTMQIIIKLSLKIFIHMRGTRQRVTLVKFPSTTKSLFPLISLISSDST